MKLIAWSVFVAILSAGSVTGAQQQPSSTPRPTSVGTQVDGFMTTMYPNLRRYLIAAVEKMPEDAMLLKPSDGARTFAATVTHVGVSNLAMCRGAAGSPLPREEQAELLKITDKAGLLKLLRDGFAACDPIFASPGDERAAFTRATLSVHGWEVYGTMAVYLRMKGIVPPSSDGSK